MSDDPRFPFTRFYIVNDFLLLDDEDHYQARENRDRLFEAISILVSSGKISEDLFNMMVTEIQETGVVTNHCLSQWMDYLNREYLLWEHLPSSEDDVIAAFRAAI